MATESAVLKSVIPMSRDLLRNVNTEIKFSADSILIESDGEIITLQEAWDRFMSQWSEVSLQFDGIKGQVGNDITIPYQLNPQEMMADREVTADLIGYDPLYMDITDNTTDSAGTKYAIVTLKSGYRWSDGTTDPKRIPWTTIENKINNIPVQINIPEYDGATHTPVFNYYDTNCLVISGTRTGVAVDEYEVTFTPKDNYVWSIDITDTAKASITVKWKIDPKEISLPIQIDPETVDGEKKTPTWNISNISLYFEITGDIESSIAGVHSVGFKPKNCAWWADNHRREKRTAYWSILAAGLPVVSWDLAAIPFTGDQIHPEWQNYDPSTIDIVTGTALVSSARDTGRYTTKFKPKEGLTWEGGSTQIITCNWRITPKQITVPNVSQNFIPEYEPDGSYSPSISNLDEDWVEVIGDVATTSGIHTVTFSLKEEEVNKNNIIWETTLNSLPLFSTWSVSKKRVAKPDISSMISSIPCEHDNNGKLKFTGPTVIMPHGKSGDLKYISVSGNREKDISEANPYTMIMTLLNNNYCWEDGSTSPISFSWRITTKTVPLPTVSGTYSYTGKDQKISFNMYEDFITVVNNSDIVKTRGLHTTTFRLKKEGTVWLGLTGSKQTEDYTITYEVGYLYITIPDLEKVEYDYTGGLISLQYTEDKEPDLFWISVKDVTGTKIGTYTAVFDLIDKENTRWAVENNTTEKERSWSIMASSNEIVLSATQGKITGSESSHFDLTVTVRGHCEISAVPLNSSVATAEIVSTTYRSSADKTIYVVRFKDGGTTGQTSVTISGNSSGGYSAPQSRTFTIISQPYRKLPNCTLADMLRVIRNEQIETYWKPGDKGKIQISSGKLGDLTVGGNYNIIYLGNNQGDDRAHFMLQSSRTDTIEGALFSADFRHTDGSSHMIYGWDYSHIRALLNGFINLFPSDWQDYFKSNQGKTTKKTQQSFEITPSSINSLPLITQDALFIPSPYEIFGDIIVQNPSAITSKEEWGAPLKLYDNLMTDRKYNKQYPYFEKSGVDLLSWIPNYGQVPGVTNYTQSQSDKGSLMLRANLGWGSCWYNKNSKMIEDAVHNAGGLLICFSLA